MKKQDYKINRIVETKKVNPYDKYKKIEQKLLQKEGKEQLEKKQAEIISQMLKK